MGFDHNGKHTRAVQAILMLTALALSLSCTTAPTGSSSLVSDMEDLGLDSYGGLQSVRSRASGFFRVEQIGGRWWLVTPEGNVFLSSGVNHADYKEDYSAEFVGFVVDHLRDWGFNTVGWSQESMNPKFVKGNVVHSRGWGPEQYRHAEMPYVHLIPFAEIAWYRNEQFPDVFSEEFAKTCDRLASEVCPELRDDPNLIGYCYSDAPNWPLWASKVGGDRIGEVAERYYQVIHDAIRRYDPNHLLLGDRYKADRSIPMGTRKVRGVMNEVLEAMKGTVDVLSLEYYRPDEEFDQNLRSWSSLTGKPVLLADSAFHAPTEVLKVSPDSPSYVPDQSARGAAYQEFARRAYANPLVVGYHWCAFGRSRGRGSGLLDGSDQPYEACVSRMRAFNNQELYRVALGGIGDATATTASEPDRDRDRYGGTRTIRADGTGFFRAEEIGGRWWLVTPEGHGFISVGMNHIDLAALKHADNIYIFRERYGSSTDRFIEEGVGQPLREWGFNTIGWTQESVGGKWMDPKTLLRHSHEWSHRQFQLAGLPYVYNLQFSEIEFFNTNPFYPDVFSQDFENWADYIARSNCVDMAKDPLLIGYADLPVPAFTADLAGAWAEGLNLSDAGDRQKLEKIVRRYFQVTSDAIRRYDPNHMIFGPRFDRPPETREWIIKIAGEYFDVLLCNRFVSPEAVASGVRRWYEVSGKPVIISDLAYLAPTELLSVSQESAAYVPDQKARGKAYQMYCGRTLSLPYVIGMHWCAFIENRARKSGIKNYRDEPYQDLVAQMQSFNRNQLYATVKQGVGQQ